MKINKAALDQAAAARKKYRADTPLSLYSVEGEDTVFIAAYLEAVNAGQPVEHTDTLGYMDGWRNGFRSQHGGNVDPIFYRNADKASVVGLLEIAIKGVAACTKKGWLVNPALAAEKGYEFLRNHIQPHTTSAPERESVDIDKAAELLDEWIDFRKIVDTRGIAQVCAEVWGLQWRRG